MRKLILIGIALIFLLPLVSASVLFNDTFTGATAALNTVSPDTGGAYIGSSNWQRQNGIGNSTTTAGRVNSTFSYYANDTQTSIQFQLRVQEVGGTNDLVLFKNASNTGFGAMGIATNYGGTDSLQVLTSGSFVNLFTGASSNVWYNVTLYNISFTSRTYMVRVNDTNYTNAGAGYIMQGSAATMSGVNNVEFWKGSGTGYTELDNVSVCDGGICSGPPAPAKNATVTAYNMYTNTTILNISVWENTTILICQTVNGTCNLPYRNDSTGSYDLLVGSNESGGYFNTTKSSQSVTNNINVSLAQNAITFFARDAVTNQTIAGATFNTSVMTNTTHYFNNRPNYNVSVVAPGYTTQTIQYNVTALTVANYTFTLNNYQLNLTAFDFYINRQIFNFTVTIANSAGNYSQSFNASAGSVNATLSNQALYNITFSSASDLAFNFTTNYSTNSSGPSIDSANTSDGKWDTYARSSRDGTGTGNIIYYWNYTTPYAGMTPIAWHVKDGGSERILTNIAACVAQNPFRARAISQDTAITNTIAWECWNGGGWTTIFTASNTVTAVNRVYEQELVYNETPYLSQTYLNYNVSSGNLTAYLSQSEINFTAIDSITGFTIGGATFNTSRLTNSTHYFLAQPWNVSAVAAGYTTKTIQYNATGLQRATYTFTLDGKYLFNVTSARIGGVRLSNFSVEIKTGSYNYTITTTNQWANFTLSPNSLYNITVYSFKANESHFNYTFMNYNITTSPNLTFNYTVLNITAINNVTGFSVTSFSSELNSSNFTNNPITQSSNVAGQILYYTMPGINYYLRTNSSGFILPQTDTMTINVTSGVQNYTTRLVPFNAVLFYLYNASSLLPANLTNITINLLGSAGNYTNVSDSGQALIQNITPGNYTVQASGTGYQTYTAYVEVGNNTYQTFNIYLNSYSSTTTIFDVIDKFSGSAIVNASMLIQTQPILGGSYVTLGTFYTDVAGNIELNYVPNQNYYFVLSANNYQTMMFYLTPVLSSTYTLKMNPNITSNITDIYQSLTVTVTPFYVFNNRSNNFTYYVAAPYGNLQAFNYTLTTTYSGTHLTGQSTNAYGGTLNTSLFVSAPNVNDSIIFQYRYKLTNGLDVTVTRVLPITGVITQGSFISSVDNPYHLPLFDRVVITVVLVIMFSGMILMFGGPPAFATIVAMIILGYVLAIGFLSFWVVGPSLFMLIVLLIRSGGQ